MIQAKFLLALDRNIRVLSPIEMSVHRREAVCREELCVMRRLGSNFLFADNLSVARSTVIPSKRILSDLGVLGAKGEKLRIMVS
jgi:hypothetical protein